MKYTESTFPCMGVMADEVFENRNTICIFLKHNEGKKKVALVVLFKKVGSNRHFQNEQICHEVLCNILNLKKKSFQTFEMFI